MPKKIKLFTVVVAETSGDLMAAKKLLDLFPDEKEIEIEWVIMKSKPPADALIASVPHVKVTHVHNWGEIDRKTCQDTDMFVLYPHVPFNQGDEDSINSVDDFLDPQFRTFLHEIPQDKILLTCSEYNCDNLDAHRLIEKHYPLVQRLDTGFRRLGIFMGKPKTREDLLAQFRETESKFAEQLFKSQSEENYFAHHHLYFGYLNTSIKEVSRNQLYREDVDSEMFILACIRNALQENQEQKGIKKDIDIIVPVADAVLMFILEKLTKEEREQLGSITFLSNQNEVKKTASESGVNLRVINPFPLKHPAMLYLIAQSNPLTMCTGDQSFNEALTYNKLCLYQIMSWKWQFYGKYLEEVEAFCSQSEWGGKRAALYRFYALFNKGFTKVGHWKTIQAFYQENKTVLLEQQKQLGAHLLKNSNLNESFLPAIKKALFPHPLIKAVAIGDEKAISAYLSENKLAKGEIDHIRDCGDNTLLMLAARKQNIACMELLIKAGANINKVNTADESALWYAFDSENMELIELLLINHVSLELKVRSSLRMPALEVAEQSYRNRGDKFCERILYYHHSRLLSKLLENQSAENYVHDHQEDCYSLLSTATKAKRADVIEAILKKADLDNPEAQEVYLYALTYAVLMGQEESVKALLTTDKINFAELNFQYMNEAVSAGYFNIVDMLSKKIPDLLFPRTPQKPLDMALKRGDIKMLRMLWSHFTPEQKTESIKIYQDFKSSVNFLYMTLINPSKCAAGKNILPILDFLMDEMKFDINQIIWVDFWEMNTYQVCERDSLTFYIKDIYLNDNIQHQVIEFLVDRGAKFDSSILSVIDARLSRDIVRQEKTKSPQLLKNINELKEIKNFFLGKLSPLLQEKEKSLLTQFSALQNKAVSEEKKSSDEKPKPPSLGN